jgi:hypothetical protein
MIGLFLRLLALVAVVLTPAAMMSAPAAAKPATVSSTGSHCAGHQDEQRKEQPPVNDEAQCLACAGLLVAERPHVAELPWLRAALLAGHLHKFMGIEPELATPPPKRI